MKYPKNDLEELYKLHEKYNNINIYIWNILTGNFIQIYIQI